MSDAEIYLVESLNDGVFERPLWNTFLERLREITHSQYATFTFRAFGNESIVALSAGSGPPAVLRAHVSRRRLHRRLPFEGLPRGGSGGLGVLFGAGERQEEANARRELAAQGIDYVRVQAVAGPGHAESWITCGGPAPYEDAAARLLGRLAPHLRQALRTYLVIERERFSSAVTMEAAQRSNFGWLTLDAECRIVGHTAVMDGIFRDSGQVWRDDRHYLRFRSPAIARQVAHLVETFARTPACKPKAVVLSRDPWMDMLVAPIQNRSDTVASSAVAIVYMRSDVWSQADRCDQLAELFGLTKREAQLAWALSQGMNLSEAAHYLGIAIETARSYSKKAYSKTGARGQGELVRIILTSVLALA